MKLLFPAWQKRRLDRAVATLAAPRHSDAADQESAAKAVAQIQTQYASIDPALERIAAATLTNKNDLTASWVQNAVLMMRAAASGYANDVYSRLLSKEITTMSRASTTSVTEKRDWAAAQKFATRVAKLADRIQRYYDTAS